MARDTIVDSVIIEDKNALIDYFSTGCKPEKQWRIGTEHEKFPFYEFSRQPVPYDSEKGISKLLESMQVLLGWKSVIDDTHVVGLIGPEGFGAISLEPGGQFELSGAPLTTIHQICDETQLHLSTLQQAAESLGIRFLGMGVTPLWTRKDIPSMPKSRYRIMASYMPKVGNLGLDMMYRTSTIQVNLDFSSELDMRRKMQIATKLQPLVTALFASSPFTEGRPNGFLSWRSEIWRDTDKNRTGILPFVFSSNFGFEDYAEWALDIPMYFVLRNGRHYDATDITFRQFMQGNLRGRFPAAAPTIGDWENHLSCLFPEVRLKKFLEMRGSDGGPWRRICALPAYWTGLLYDATALDTVDALVQDWTLDEVQDMRNTVPRLALKTPFRKITLQELALETLKIAREGLQRRHQLNSMGNDETHFLDSLDEIANRGITEAEKMLSAYHGKWQGSLEPIFTEYAC